MEGMTRPSLIALIFCIYPYMTSRREISVSIPSCQAWCSGGMRIETESGALFYDLYFSLPLCLVGGWFKAENQESMGEHNQGNK